MISCHTRRIIQFVGAFAIVTLQWDPNPPDQYIASYRIYRATSSTGAYTLLKTVKTPSVSTRVEIPSLETRCYKLKAVNILGQVSPFSAEICRTAE